MRPAFGEFLATATSHIEAATSLGTGLPGLPADAVPEVVTQAGRLIAVMARCADAFNPGDLASLHCLDAHEHALLDARGALRQAAAQMRLAAGTLAGIVASDDTHPCAQQLAAAADCLAAGHDLLHTHFAPGAPGTMIGRSPWAATIASPAIHDALVTAMTGCAGRLAPWALQLTMTGESSQALPRRARVALSAACRSLRVAEAAGWAATHHSSAASAQALLHTIAANTLPPRCPPNGNPPVALVCASITATAERLRHLTHAAAARAPRAATGAAVSWQRTAQGAAITGHCTQLIVGQFADPATGLPSTSTAGTALRQARDAAHDAWRAWRTVAHQWDTFTTGLPQGLSRVAAEISDLAVWTGRLAHNDPGWTPARNRTSPLRTAAALADSPPVLTVVITALCQASDALASIARVDRESVRAALASGAVFVPTRLLPASHDLPYRYSPITATMTDALLRAYDTAIHASTHATTTLTALAPNRGIQLPALTIATTPARQRPTGSVDHALSPGISQPVLQTDTRTPDHAAQGLAPITRATPRRHTATRQRITPPR
jgi:hypothetical protein